MDQPQGWIGVISLSLNASSAHNVHARANICGSCDCAVVRQVGGCTDNRLLHVMTCLKIPGPVQLVIISSSPIELQVPNDTQFHANPSRRNASVSLC